MTSNEPVVTIGVPVYNGENYLAGTLESLLAQDFDDFELIISDNGSVDGTERICRDFAERDSRVRYERHESNRGASWNFSQLVARGSGRYFKWSGHDDLYEPSYLRECVEHLDGAPPSVVLCYPRTVLIGGEGRIRGLYDDGLDLRSASPHERVRKLLRNLGLANAVFGLIRRDVLRTTRLLEPFNESDLVLLLELALRGELHELDTPLFYRRMHEQQAYQANQTRLDVARWFDPERRPRVLMPRTRRFAEMARSIIRAPIPVGERTRAGAILVREWGPRYLWFFCREVAQLARGTTLDAPHSPPARRSRRQP